MVNFTMNDSEIQAASAVLKQAAEAAEMAAYWLKRVLERGSGYEHVAPRSFQPLLVRTENIAVALRQAIAPTNDLCGRQGQRATYQPSR